MQLVKELPRYWLCEADAARPRLQMRCRPRVDDKGFAVDALVEDVRWLGYSRVTLKSDNEPAVVKLLAESLR